MSRNTRRSLIFLGLVLLVVFAVTVWPTLHQQWKLNGRDYECVVRENRFTGNVEYLCTHFLDEGWNESKPKEGN